MSAESLWVGALSDTSVTVAARLAINTRSARIVATSAGGTVRSTAVASSGNWAKMTVTGLTPDTSYTYGVEVGSGNAAGLTGTFKTAPSGNASFTVALSGDASEGSNHVVFDTIRAAAPLMFFHMGDLHYRNVDVANVANYRAAYLEVLSNTRQAALYREIPTAYVWDDHDYTANNSDSSNVGRAASAAAYRAFVPHYPLSDSIGIWQTWDIGRVRFIMTDQRSYASANAATDNSSKTMLGATQKAWFKNLLENSPGKVIAWICPRLFGGVATAGADHWGGFTTERAELVSHIHTHCPGRAVVLSADMHAVAIDDGTNHDFLPGGGEPLRIFQCAPLDRSPSVGGYGGATFSEGLFDQNNLYGTMEVSDSGGESIGITWRGFNSSAALLTSHAFTVSL